MCARINPSDSVIQEVASKFFETIGAGLPYQCASDEFYFLPRCEKAVDHLGNLDELCPEKVQDLVGRVKRLMALLPENDSSILDDEIDRITLKKSMERFIYEYEYVAAWTRDPTLYIKVALFAVDEILSRRTQVGEDPTQALESLLSQIPKFLSQGLENLVKPSALSVSVAIEMVNDAMAFFHRDITRFIEEMLASDSGLLRNNLKVLAGWEVYGNRLKNMETDPSFPMGEAALAQMLSTGVSSDKSPAEVLELAQDRYRTTLGAILRLADKIDPGTPWQDLARNAGLSAESQSNVVELYQEEVDGLRRFFYERDLITFPAEEEVEVLPTPIYLRSLRATASYRAPLTGRPVEAGRFYITPGSELSGLLLSHKPYLSAHETYPGHHVLDTIRIHHPNFIRRQIESPIFYEGWACYAETLLDEYGYTFTPQHRLAQLQRQLWRELRAALDIRLQTGRISLEEGAREIEKIGFPAAASGRQIRRFALTPGYQSCYFLGMEEILRLRSRYAGVLGTKGFHDYLLQGGQVSFDLAEKRLSSAIDR